MPARQPQFVVVGIDESEAATLDLRRIALAIIAAHDLRRQTRDFQSMTVTEYLELARRRRAAELEVRDLIRNRHAARGRRGEERRESQSLDELWRRVALKVPMRTTCDIGLLAHMARIRRQIDVPLAIVVHVLDELGWRPSEIARSLDEHPRQIGRHLARTVLDPSR